MFAALPSTMTATLDTEEHLSLLTWQDAGSRRDGYDVKFVRNVTDVDDKILNVRLNARFCRPNWPRPIPSVCRKISVNSAACSER